MIVVVNNLLSLTVGLLKIVQGEDMAGVFHQCGQSICKRTRDEMDERARIIAHALAEQGVCDNDVVAILIRVKSSKLTMPKS